MTGKPEVLCITDTDRINAIESGFCICAQDTLTPDGWTRVWAASYSVDKTEYGSTFRMALDAAIIAYRSAVH